MAGSSTAPTVRGLIVRLVVLGVWIALIAVSIASGDSLRVTVSFIGFAATAAAIALWGVQRRRSRGDDGEPDPVPRTPDA